MSRGNPIVPVRLTPVDVARVDRIAGTRNLSRSAVIRIALEQLLRDVEAPPPPPARARRRRKRR